MRHDPCRPEPRPASDEAIRRMIAAAKGCPGFDGKTLAEVESCYEKRWR
jgi:hypothetical protein